MPSASIAHSMSCGAPRATAIRRASVASAHCLAAVDGVLRPAARGGSVVTDDPFVAEGRAGHEPLTDAPHRGDDAGAPIAVDRIGGERDAGRGRLDHPLDDHRHPPVAAGLVLGGAGRARAGQASVDGGRRAPRPARPGPTRRCRRRSGRRRPRRSRSIGPRTGRCRDPPAAVRSSDRRSSAVSPGDAGRQDDPVRHADTRGQQLSEARGLAADLGAHRPCARRCSRRTAGGLIVRFLGVAAAMAARTTQSTSSAASSTDEPRWSRHMRSADDAVRTTRRRAIRSRSASASLGAIESAKRRIDARADPACVMLPRLLCGRAGHGRAGEVVERIEAVEDRAHAVAKLVDRARRDRARRGRHGARGAGRAAARRSCFVPK